MNVFDRCLNSVWPTVSTVLFGQKKISVDDSYMEKKTVIRVNQAKEKARPGNIINNEKKNKEQIKRDSGSIIIIIYIKSQE